MKIDNENILIVFIAENIPEENIINGNITYKENPDNSLIYKKKEEESFKDIVLSVINSNPAKDWIVLLRTFEIINKIESLDSLNCLSYYIPVETVVDSEIIENNIIKYEKRLFKKGCENELLKIIPSSFPDNVSSCISIINNEKSFPNIESLKFERELRRFFSGKKNLSNILYVFQKDIAEVNYDEIEYYVEKYSVDDEEKEVFFLELNIEIAKKFINKNNFSKAEEILLLLKNKYGNSPNINFLLGKIYLEKSSYKKAEEYFLICLNFGINHNYYKFASFTKGYIRYLAFYNIGKAYFNLKEWFPAFDSLKAALIIEPNFYSARNKLEIIKQHVDEIINDSPYCTFLIKTNMELWKEALSKRDDSKRILISNLGGRFFTVSIEMILTIALTLRGAKVHILLCDESLPACELARNSLKTMAPNFNFKNAENFIKYGPKRKICPVCFDRSNNMFKSLGIDIHYYSDFFNEDDIVKLTTIAESVPYEDIKGFIFEGIPVGEDALSAALRFSVRGSLDDYEFSYGVLKRYLVASMLTVVITQRFFKEYKFDAVVSHHGIYVPQGTLNKVVHKHNMRIVNWVSAYRNKCFIFSHDDTYHHTMMFEPVSKWENIKFTPKLEEEFLEYLPNRYIGTMDWKKIHRDPSEYTIEQIEKITGIDFSKPCIGLLTNVIWDAQLNYPENIFKNMMDWVIKTVKYFSGRKDFQLIIRVHPSETKSNIEAMQKVVPELNKAFPVLPENLFIIDSTSNINTYMVMEKCNCALIYATKAGIEMLCLGKPVIVAGEAWVKNKNITFDPKTEEEYFKLLDELPFQKELEKDRIDRARKYGFHFFFRKMIPMEFFESLPGCNLYKPIIKNLQNLLPGNYKGLDVICEGILNGTDFIYPYEELCER